ncbi:DJ-1/PfpI family protein [Aeromicrobium endophyticum]|uniref:DJ-1/PfpI family protein n=1 Tax=Aeromicrobium endophyticum TaxID=2292704 RepID=A0A371NZT4_9ACTN|nr:DJ-1/PfpI family protein [Aeromicrobium endophyticum]REK68908.1 DJ-1/PfpI family protein [Aeromicrobium endophyticum]
MKVAIVLYPDFTALDVVGPYHFLAGVPGAEVVFVADTAGPVVNDIGSLAMQATRGLDDVLDPDVVVIGGGPGYVAQTTNTHLHEWLRTVDRSSTWTTSACTGSLILASAGLLEGRRATTHWGALAELTDFGAHPSDDRVVIDGKYATAAGVSAGIDMALTLIGLMSGDEAAQTSQLLAEYAPSPPYRSGSLHAASPEVVARAKELLA